MHFIGFVGRAGSGKHRAGAAVVAFLDENGYSAKMDSFGRDIKRELWSAEGLVDKEKDRRSMQILGAAKRRQDPFCLVNSLAVRNNITAVGASWEPADFLVVADIRDENELNFCRDRGIVIMIDGSHKALEGSEAEHPSEDFARRITTLDVDFWIPKQRHESRTQAIACDFVRQYVASLKGAIHA